MSDTDDRADGVDDLIAELAEEGQVDSAGGFTLDRAMAREKMAQFQLAEPHTYVLELVQAAVLKGAQRIEFTIDADDMRMRFDGRPFSRSDLEDLYDAALSEGSGPDWEARRELAIALHAAQSLKLSSLVVASGTGEVSAQLVVRRGSTEVLRTRDLGTKNTHIHVKRRFLHLDLKRLGQSLTGRLPEEKVLKERCRWARLPIDLDGRRISLGNDPPADKNAVQLDDGDLRALAWRRPDREDRTVHFARHGVVIVTRRQVAASAQPGGFEAVVDGPDLRTDLSQRDLVTDSAFERAQALAERALGLAARLFCLEAARTWEPSMQGDQVRKSRIWDLVQTRRDNLIRVQAAGSSPLVCVTDKGRVYERHGAQWRIRKVAWARDQVAAAWTSGPEELVVADDNHGIWVWQGSSWDRKDTADIVRLATAGPRLAKTPAGAPKAQRSTDRAGDTSGEDKWLSEYEATEPSPAPKRLASRRYSGENVNAYWAPSRNSLWAVGSNGGVFHRHYGRWYRHEIGTDEHLRGVWAHDDDCVVVVGRRGTVFGFDGHRWRRATGVGADGDWRGVWGSGPSDVYMVGAVAADYRSQIWGLSHYDGQTWTRVDLPLPQEVRSGRKSIQGLTAVWGCSPDRVFAVGSEGVIVRYDGQAWQYDHSGTTQGLRSVWGTAPDDVYAVGWEFSCLRFNGRSWSPVLPPLERDRVGFERLSDRLRQHRKLVYAPDGKDLPERLVEAAGTRPIIALTSELTEAGLQRLLGVLQRHKIHRV